MQYHKWTIEEHNYLKFNYPKLGLKRCSNFLNIPIGAVKNKVKRFKLKLDNTLLTKICSVCNIEKNIRKFNKRADTKIGLRSECNLCFNTRMTKRRNTDFAYKIRTGCSRRILLALNGRLRVDKSFNLIGCTPKFLKEYLESKFKSGMSWENHGQFGWHIDHIKPCASFDLTKEEEQRKCFHYSNLQPLWWRDNLSKSDKISPPIQVQNYFV